MYVYAFAYLLAHRYKCADAVHRIQSRRSDIIGIGRKSGVRRAYDEIENRTDLDTDMVSEIWPDFDTTMKLNDFFKIEMKFRVYESIIRDSCCYWFCVINFNLSSRQTRSYFALLRVLSRIIQIRFMRMNSSVHSLRLDSNGWMAVLMRSTSLYTESWSLSIFICATSFQSIYFPLTAYASKRSFDFFKCGHFLRIFFCPARIFFEFAAHTGGVEDDVVADVIFQCLSLTDERVPWCFFGSLPLPLGTSPCARLLRLCVKLFSVFYCSTSERARRTKNSI